MSTDICSFRKFLYDPPSAFGFYYCSLSPCKNRCPKYYHTYENCPMSINYVCPMVYVCDFDVNFNDMIFLFDHLSGINLSYTSSIFRKIALDLFIDSLQYKQSY